MLRGVQFLNELNEVILKAGAHEHKDWWSELREFRLDKSERVIGVKSGSRGEPYAYHFDVQFVIGK